jgi:hypothetical protein
MPTLSRNTKRKKEKPIMIVGIVVLIPNTTITTVTMGLGASLDTANTVPQHQKKKKKSPL